MNRIFAFFAIIYMRIIYAMYRVRVFLLPKHGNPERGQFPKADSLCRLYYFNGNVVIGYYDAQDCLFKIKQRLFDKKMGIRSGKMRLKTISPLRIAKWKELPLERGF